MTIEQHTQTRLPGQRRVKRAQPGQPARRRRFRALAPVAAAVAVGLVAVAVATGNNTHAPAAGNTFAQAAVNDASAEARLIVAGPSAALPLTDGDWRLDGVVVDKSWFTGNYTGAATLTYTGKAAQADADFSVGVYTGTTYVGRLTGTVHALPSGQHAFVSLSSLDEYESGPYHYAFLDVR